MKKLLTTLLIVAILGSLAGCGSSNSNNNDVSKTYTGELQGALKDYSFKIGTSGTFAPFTYYDKDGKTLIGFDMDLLKELQKILGFKTDGDIQAMDYSPLTTSLSQGKLDIGIGAICATDTRKKVMNFTNAYYNSGLTVIVNKNSSPKGITDIDSLVKGNYKIAVQKGDASNLYLVGANVPSERLEVHDSITTALESLEGSKVDALVYDTPGTAYYIANKKDSKLQMIGKQFAEDQSPYAIAVSFDASKKNPELVSIINAAIKELKDNGTIEKLNEKWCK